MWYREKKKQYFLWKNKDAPNSLEVMHFFFIFKMKYAIIGKIKSYTKIYELSIQFFYQKNILRKN